MRLVVLESEKSEWLRPSIGESRVGLAIADYGEGNVVTEAVAHTYEVRAGIHQEAGRSSLARTDREAVARWRRLLDEP